MICSTRYGRTGEMRDKIVNAILSNNVGQIPDGVNRNTAKSRNKICQGNNVDR